MAKRASKQSFGDLIRHHRVKVLEISTRKAATLVGFSQPWLSKLENNLEVPSEDNLMGVHRGYGIPEAVLRAACARPETVVNEVASQDADAAAKVPVLLRTARSFNKDEWDQLIEHAERIRQGGGKP